MNAQRVVRPLLVVGALLVCADACGPHSQPVAPYIAPYQSAMPTHPATADALSTLGPPLPSPDAPHATALLLPTPTIQLQRTPQSTARTTPTTATSLAASTFYGVGVVTRINPALPSIELNHAAITGYMPAMTMEYFVQNKGLLHGISVGERVTFTIRDQGSTPVIVNITGVR